jgi:membrane protease YdiL (CAAX protease family)
MRLEGRRKSALHIGLPMSTQILENTADERPAGILARNPIASYFVLAFAISWTAALLVTAPYLLRGQRVPKFAGLIMFPAMLLGPSLAGIVLMRIVDGKSGLRALFTGMGKVQVATKWYLTLLIPPVLMVTVLSALKLVWSPVFTPNFFLMGFLFGVPAGFLEEIGWTGYALPKMNRVWSPLAAAMLLGVIWGTWHLPVINYLGTAAPHGSFWLRYFMAFTAAMTAMRVIIAWVYGRTQSVLLAQLLHVSSTGSLVVFSPSGATAGQEANWYFVYAAALWLVVTVIVAKGGESAAGAG